MRSSKGPKAAPPALCEKSHYDGVESTNGKSFLPYLEPCGYLDKASMLYSGWGLFCTICACSVSHNTLEVHMMRRGKEHGIKPAMAKEASNHILATQGPLPNRGTFPECLTEESQLWGNPRLATDAQNAKSMLPWLRNTHMRPSMIELRKLRLSGVMGGRITDGKFSRPGWRLNTFTSRAGTSIPPLLLPLRGVGSLCSPCLPREHPAAALLKKRA